MEKQCAETRRLYTLSQRVKTRAAETLELLARKTAAKVQESWGYAGGGDAHFPHERGKLLPPRTASAEEAFKAHEHGHVVFFFSLPRRERLRRREMRGFQRSPALRRPLAKPETRIGHFTLKAPPPSFILRYPSLKLRAHSHSSAKSIGIYQRPSRERHVLLRSIYLHPKASRLPCVSLQQADRVCAL